jgi:hypothetical protein
MQLGNFSVSLAVKDIAASRRSTKNSASNGWLRIEALRRAASCRCRLLSSARMDA